MAPYSHWKAKVVVSFIVILLAFSFSSNGQSGYHGRITLSCKDIDVREFTRRLKNITGLNFIYSTDRIETDHRINVSVEDVHLDELFQLVGKQTNLDFIKQGRYVVIKSGNGKSAAAGPGLPKKIKPVADRSEGSEDEVDEPPVVSRKPNEGYQNFSAVDAELLVNKYFKYFQSTPDFSVLDYIPGKAVRHFKNDQKQWGWFASAGPFINDHSTGLELHAGIPSLYAVFQTSWLSNGRPRQAFGLGTTFSLFDNFSFSPGYTYSAISYSEERTHQAINGITVNNALNVSAKQHQMRFLLEYTPFQRISFRAGLSVNQLTANYRKTEPLVYVDGIVVQHYNARYSTPGDQYPPPIVRYRAVAIRRIPPPVELKYWLSWEAGLSYKINFSPGP